MVKNNSEKIRYMVELALFSALIVLLQLLSNVFKIGGVPITLSLVPLVIGAAKRGPLAGTILGFILGLVNFASTFADGSLTLFLFQSSPFLYILVCFGKTMLAGLAAGWIYRALARKSSFLSVCLASVSAPVVNTGLFFVMMLCFFRTPLIEFFGGNIGGNIVSFILITLIGINFLVELLLNAVLCPAIERILHAVGAGKKSE